MLCRSIGSSQMFYFSFFFFKKKQEMFCRYLWDEIDEEHVCGATGSSQTKQETRQHVVMVIVVVSDGGGGSYTVLYLPLPLLELFLTWESFFLIFFSSFRVCLSLLEDWEFPWAGSKEIGMGYWSGLVVLVMIVSQQPRTYWDVLNMYSWTWMK